MKIVTGLFRDQKQAQQVLATLQQAGLDRDRLSLITAVNAQELPDLEEQPEKTAVEGAALGGTLGSLLGLLGSIIVVPLPGFGPMLASGLMATAAGGVLGGYLGSVYSVRAASKTELNIKEELADGAVLMIVHIDGIQTKPTAAEIIKKGGGAYVEQHDLDSESFLS
jgi:hypothetical protein